MSKFTVTFINLDNMQSLQRAFDCADVSALAALNESEIKSLNAQGGDWVVNGFMDEFDVNSYIGIDGQEYIS
ncbi:MAG: hypothetical protein ACRCXB_19235 [Aeromonadaceae bacterium]